MHAAMEALYRTVLRALTSKPTVFVGLQFKRHYDVSPLELSPFSYPTTIFHGSVMFAIGVGVFAFAFTYHARSRVTQ